MNNSNTSSDGVPASGLGIDLKWLNFVHFGILQNAICVAGIIGNILVIMTLSRKRFKATATDKYLKWMALADVLVLISWFPMSQRFVEMFPAYRNKTLAMYYLYFGWLNINSFFGLSALLVSIVSIDRWIGIQFPLAAKSMILQRHPNRVTFLTMLFCFGTHIATYDVDALVEIKNEQNETLYKFIQRYNTPSQELQAYITTRTIMMNMFPVFVTTLANISILRRFRKIKQLKKAITGNTNEKKALRQEYRVTAILICAAVIFFFCKMPISVYFMLVYEGTSLGKRWFAQYRAFVNNVNVLNSALNFYMYCFACSAFRRQLLDMLCCGTRRVMDSDATITLQTRTVRPINDGESVAGHLPTVKVAPKRTEHF